ncbi:hypothetical protein RKD19_002901 [Streptomyces canus]|uniref:hypothetical protein n=1 Tax=unclassified Streptomyces TaxID=2593676 RepID=UPI000F648E0A|nr:hypothetical protein [Streptomyces sp. RP5T]RRR85265.1 hypothetical protein EHS43_08860 [Streptomyces sp. RP5T]
MRPTTHRTALALAALTLLLAGCGTEAGSEGGGGSDSASPSPPPSVSASPSSGCTPVTGDLGAADSGDTVCLAVGDTVRVGLDGTRDRPWKPVAVDGRGLEATNSGIVLLPGDANAAYRAVSAGTVRLSSTRPLCATETGKVSCKGIQEWRVTVVIT